MERTRATIGRVVSAAWWAGCALGIAGPAAGAGLQAQTPDPARVDAVVERIRSEIGIPGVALAVVRGDSTLLLRGYGEREAGGGEPVGPGTLFSIGSATKAFTATLAAMLVDEGALAWDDRVVDLVPGFGLSDPYPTAEATLRDLLAHRSGLPPANLMWLATDPSADTLIRRLRRLEPVAGFRSAFTYQNGLYLVAGRALEEAAGRPWAALLTERILDPLGMDGTNASVTRLSGRSDVATPHVLDDGIAVPVPYRDIDDVAPAGAINSSARDLARWLRFLLADGETPEGRRLVDAATLAETRTPQTVVPADPVTTAFHPAARLQAYGMGWFVSDFHGRTLVAHGGGIDGMSALVAWVPEEELGVAILTNLQTPAPVWVYGILYAVLDPALGVEPTDWEAPYRAVEALFAEMSAGLEEGGRVEGTRPTLAPGAYVGSYTSPTLGEVRVERADDGALEVRYGTLEGALEHWHHDTFRVRWRDRAWRAAAGPGWITFRLDRSGAVGELVLEALPGEREVLTR